MADPTLSHVLLVLRVRGVAPSAAVAERAGVPTAVVDEVLGSALDAGWVTQSSGRLAGWSLSAAGRRHGEQLLAEQVDSAGLRTELESVYGRFLGLNGELLSICTDWQVVRVDGVEVLNDHADAARDRAVLARLEQLHGAAAPLTDRLASLLVRFSGYSPRLSAARRRISAGEHEWLTRPTIDSYHTVWFELHENLLATLGRSRTQERGPRHDTQAESSAAHEEYA
jgi:hypothetical protein